MGKLNVYFPSKSKWATDAPSWAKPYYEEVLEDLGNWCAKNKIPISIVDDGYIGTK